MEGIFSNGVSIESIPIKSKQGFNILVFLYVS